MKTPILKLLGLLALASGLLLGADIDGKWTAKVGKGEKVTETLTLKANGNKLTGTLERPSGAANVTEGVINGNNVSFKVVRDRNGKAATQQYKGTLSGGELKMTVTGRRGGTRDVAFKRAK
jgi:hypothetical protein